MTADGATGAAEPAPSGSRTRRPPPPFREVRVVRVTSLTPRLIRVTFTGDEVERLAYDLPAASVRLLVPWPGQESLVIPEWNGNEFLLPGGRRPAIRTFTPRRVDVDRQEIDLDMVVHGEGPASAWAESAEPGAEAAISGPGRGYTIDTGATQFVLLGDETAIPAVSQLLESLPERASIAVHLEVAVPEARLELPEHADALVQWHVGRPDAPHGEALVAAVSDAVIHPGTKVWAAGEAAAMQRIRRILFEERGLARSDATVRGYWKHGRAGDSDDDGPRAASQRG